MAKRDRLQRIVDARLGSVRGGQDKPPGYEVTLPGGSTYRVLANPLADLKSLKRWDAKFGLAPPKAPEDPKK